MKIALLALPALLLTACATDRRCGPDADYRKAGAVPPITAAEGLKVPESPSALKVPALTPAAIEAAQQPRGDDKRAACLDYPPEITPVAAAPDAAKR